MIKVILVGACGKMGRFIASTAENDPDVEIVAGVDQVKADLGFPVFQDFSEVSGTADVLIDFSNPVLLEPMLAFAEKSSLPVVIATTGYSEEQIKRIHEAAQKIPVFFTFNMSVGVNLLCALAKKAAEVLGNDFDVEIIEKHHNQKVDAPSGTAIMLANAVNTVFDDRMHYEYDRHSKRQKRTGNEIGIHSVRGGTIVGEHDVIFAGHDEVITVSHSAQSREVFAVGAMRAAKYLYAKKPGLYDMNDIMNFGS